ncbi:MAG: hypothetical protein JOZ16_00275 [Methylobacteriaceae bacterium]|nr:hypothetical protein [Methylobacteriaceae bacterium]
MAGPIPDDMKKKIFDDLARVGEGKAIGYLPAGTICNPLNGCMATIEAGMLARGLEAMAFDAEQCCIQGGALYVFDRQALQKLLASSSELLAANQWPQDQERFVRRIASEWLEPDHPLIALVKSAFGESGSVGSRDLQRGRSNSR